MGALSRYLKNSEFYLYIAYIQAVVATLGSFYFSAVAELVPCTLCWYQRIFMFPLAFIFTVGMIIKDFKRLPYYVLPLSIVGLFIAFYQYLLQFKVIEISKLCTSAAPCSQIDFELFGFITIPFLSFLAFLIITISCILAIRFSKK